MEWRGVTATETALALVCGLSMVGPLRAQSTIDSLRAGTRVRVVDTMSRTTVHAGVFVRRQTDTIAVVGPRGGTELFRMLPRHRLEVAVAKPRHIFLIGSATGAVVLGTIGALIVDPEPSQSDTCIPFGPDGSCWRLTSSGTPRRVGAAFGAAYGAALGGLAGGITGHFWPQQWKPVARDIQVAFAPVAVGTAMTVRIPIGRSAR